MEEHFQIRTEGTTTYIEPKNEHKFELRDWQGFCWFHFSWSPVSHPAISIRLRLFKYVLGVTYFRIRPWKYLHSEEYKDVGPDSRFVFDWPSFYYVKDMYEGQ